MAGKSPLAMNKPVVEETMAVHLKEESYYNDLYDLATIERCLHFPPADKWLRKFALYFIKGERYRNKSSVIREWMDRDRKRDELFQDAQEPKNVRCPGRASKMGVMLKELCEFSGEPARTLFFFECQACKKRKGVDLNTIRELMGHKSLDMTLRYSHLSKDHKVRAVSILDLTPKVSPSDSLTSKANSLKSITSLLEAI